MEDKMKMSACFFYVTQLHISNYSYLGIIREDVIGVYEVMLPVK